MKIGVIVGSTRPGNLGSTIGQWVFDRLSHVEGAQWELVKVDDFNLALLDEPTVPGAANRNYDNPSTRAWSQKIDEFDGFVFVTPEYNHGVPAAMKNAFDLLAPEWAYKPVGFVGYGAAGGVRSVEQWRQIVANAYMFGIRPQLDLSLFFDMGENGFEPLERRESEIDGLGKELVKVARATASLR